MGVYGRPSATHRRTVDSLTDKVAQSCWSVSSAVILEFSAEVPMGWKQVQMPYDELSDYRELIRASGRHPEDFEHVFEEEVGSDGPVRQRVTVRTKYGEKQYEAGHGQAWHAKFAADLKNNYFN